MARSHSHERDNKPRARRQLVSSHQTASKERASDMEDARRSVHGSGFSQDTFERHAALLGDSRMSQPMYVGQQAEMMRQLQRDYGNSYVQRLVDRISRSRVEGIQTKLEVGPAGDRYEQEADRVAKEVVSNLPSTGEAQRQDAEEEELQMKTLQRQEEEGLEEEGEELQMKALQRQEEEEELQLKPLQRAEEEEELQMKALQRQEEEEELQMKPLQRQVTAEGGEVGSDIEQTIESARGGGQPLPDALRSPMESAFGSDFSGVRVHTGQEADALNQSVSARAFTTGQDIFVRNGDYNPGSSSGKELLAHELTHVVQQSGQVVQTLERDVDAAIVQRAPLARLRQALGYKMGTKSSKKALEKAFEGREFDTSAVSVISEAELRNKFDEVEGDGAYDATGGLEGFTNTANGEIYINKDDQAVDTVPHEVLHKNSNPAVGNQMGTNLDEGITEYLTQKAATRAGFKPSSSYPDDLAVVKRLAAIVGDGPIERAYFDGDVAGLKAQLDANKAAGTFDSLVTAMTADDYGTANNTLR